MLEKLGVETSFVDGLRVTDKQTAEIAEMVLSGAINKQLVGWIARAGGKAIGLSGKDGNLVTATPPELSLADFSETLVCPLHSAIADIPQAPLDSGSAFIIARCICCICTSI